MSEQPAPAAATSAGDSHSEPRGEQSLPFDITAAAFARLPEPPVTGDPRVDDALARLGELPELPVAEHLSVYEDVHRRLHDALADLDAG